jgi:1,4-dihydroxy-2-naphthoyl-CoA hydrolase
MEASEAGLPEGMDETIGIESRQLEGEDGASAVLPVTPAILQPFGIVHGGALATLAESLCSWATYELNGPEKGAFGQSNDTSFLRPISHGAVHAHARARHRGRTTWVWEVEMLDDEDRLCALSRLTIAVRPLPTLSG